jgi:hypothetical protein
MLRRFYEFKESDLDPIKSFHLKDELNPKIWSDNNIDKEVREQLIQIAQDFFESTEISTDVIDIALCGSLCNYNWSEKYSDFDLHIIVNYSSIDDNLEIVEQLCDYAKKMWNSMHDINIKGYEVEVAIQDDYDLKKAIKSGRMGGVFSILNNKWIKRPTKADFEPNEKLISSKGSSIMTKIDDIEDQIEEDNYKSFKEKIDKIWKKIKDLRKSGLDSESGEYSIGNLVFKLLRRNNYISKIMQMKKYAYDKQFESLEDKLSSFLYSLESLDNQLKKESEEGWSMSIEYNHNEKEKTINIEYSCHGYSDGYSDNLKVYYNEIPIKVERNWSMHSTMIGDQKSTRTETFNSFDDLIKDIKNDFGI